MSRRRNRRINLIHVLLAISIIIIFAGLTGCGSGVDQDKTGKPTMQQAFDETWSAQTEENKSDMCSGIRMFGLGFAADHLADDRQDGTELALLMRDKCDVEGR